MELSSRIYDALTSAAPFPDLSIYARDLVATHVPQVGSSDHWYWRHILRLSALCHDLGHLPFSHVAESRLLGEGGHEKWTSKIIQSPFLTPLWNRFEIYVKGKGDLKDVQTDVMKMALGEKRFLKMYPEAPPFTPWERVVTEMITGDFFGADRIDYLIRDSQCTGLAYGLFDYHQLIEMLKIMPSVNEKEGLALGVDENGVESCEALLLARHYMHKRLYQYTSVKAYSFHLARFMETHYSDITKDLNRYISMTDNEVLAELNRASSDPSHKGHFDAKCLYLREGRFRAIALQSCPTFEERKEIEELLLISKEEIEWEIAQKEAKNSPLSFPVLKKTGEIDTGSNLSEVSIPSLSRSWIYVAPQYEEEIHKYLTRCMDVVG